MNTLPNIQYFMDSPNETQRVDSKTKVADVEHQATWAGVKPGMRVLDVGCGSGKTTYLLHRMVQPGGTLVGIDGSAERLEYAQSMYCAPGVTYHPCSLLKPFTSLGQFDLIWVRFVLEYFGTNSQMIVQNAYDVLTPGGTICLIDLDYNCLSHYGFSNGLDGKIQNIIGRLQRQFDFDPYMGRKLYSYLYDLGCEGLEVSMSAHHLIYGNVDESELFNWTCKLEATRPLFESDDAYRQFYDEFMGFFTDKRRFTYTPLIMCKGRKPLS